jgi:ATP-dependent Clp protease ATP-binding subunit ClpC
MGTGVAFIDYPLLLLQRVSPSGLILCEALQHPQITRLGRNTAGAAVLESLKVVLAAQPALQLYRWSAPSEHEVIRHAIHVKAVRSTASWPEPFEIELFGICYPIPGPGWCAYFPAASFSAVAETRAGLQHAIDSQLLPALRRQGALRSLHSVLQLQHENGLEVAYGSVTLQPGATKDDEKGQATLDKVASALHTKRLPPAYQREEELARLARELAAATPRSVLLRGEAGVGKTAVFQEVVRRRGEFALGSTPFYQTTGSRLIAGQIAFGAWQLRCQKVVAELQERKGIVHLGNLYELSQVARHSGDPLGMAGFFRPYLETGRLLAVCECTPQQFDLLEKEQPQLLEAFKLHPLEATGESATLRILRQSAPGVSRQALTELLALHGRWTSVLNWPGKPLRFLRNLLIQTQRPSRADVVRGFAEQTGLPLLLLDESEPLRAESVRAWFSARVRAQPEAIERVLERLMAVKTGLNRPGRPVATFLLVGPTGTGKTELARSLAEFLFGDRQRLTRLDMSEYSTSHAVTGLIGWPGSEQSGALTQKVRESPFQVVLFDELEKAHPDFFDLLLQILGDGRLTDSAGNVADFTSCLVLMTSNLGADTFGKGSLGLRDTSTPQGNFMEAVRQSLRPELLNRIDEVLPFAPLGPETVQQLARAELEVLQHRVAQTRPRVVWSIGQEVIPWLAQRGYDRRYGARPLKRAVDRALLTPLAERLLAFRPDVPLDIEVSIGAEQLQLQVRAREAAELQASYAQRMQVLEQAAELRRLVSRVGKGPLVTELLNAWTRHKRDTRKQPVPFRGQKLLELHSAVRERSRQVEEQALLYLHQGDRLPELRRDVTELRAVSMDLVRRLYHASFPRPDSALVSLFSDDSSTLKSLAQAYAQLLPPGGALRWMHITLKKGVAAVPTEHDPTPHLHRTWAELGAAGQVLGLLGEFQGKDIYPLLCEESGLHWFTGNRGFHGVLVEVTQQAAVSSDPEKPWAEPAYQLPRDVHRRSFMDNLAKLRTYHPDEQRVQDCRMDVPFEWSGPLDLRALVEYWRDQRALREALAE